jgi:hypothetical protein
MAAIPLHPKIKSAVAAWQDKGYEIGHFCALEGRKNQR